ncbi:MAG: VCBS repeat-containing protein [Flavobacteriales bacterium]|nr:VCBS repeat-containing protein [Flavobacteriales bacterium]
MNNTLKVLVVLVLFLSNIKAKADPLYYNQTTPVGKSIFVKGFTYPPPDIWYRNLKVDGHGQNFTGTITFNFYTGDLTIHNPGPVGEYTISLDIWFTYDEFDVNQFITFHESFNLTVTEHCNIASHAGKTFTNVSNTSVGNAPEAMIIKDFNKDGKEDIAVTNTMDSTVSILLGKGDGTFNTAELVSVLNSPTSITSCDFNKDGNLDLATTRRTGGKISVRYGNGNGGFSGNTEINAWGELVCGDINSDGNPDIVVAGANHMTSIFGNGQGGFTVGSVIQLDTIFFEDVPDFPLMSKVTKIQMIDFNHDGKPDIALSHKANYYQSGPSFTILLNDGNGVFYKVYEKENGGSFYSYFSIADINKDGNPDVAYKSNFYWDITAILGDGTGKFKDSTIRLGSNTDFTSFADFDNDGSMDFIASGYGNTQFYRNGEQEIISAFGAGELNTLDLNNDGKKDLACLIGGKVSIFLQHPYAFQRFICVEDQKINIPFPQNKYTLTEDLMRPLSYSGNCADASFYNDYTRSFTLKGAVFPLGTTTVKWIITDTLGIKDTCTFNVSVNQYCGAGVPESENVITGNIFINTQTQMDAFFKQDTGMNNGKNYTRVEGDLTINGSSGSDPVTDLCNLESLKEVTGHLHIRQFNKNSNPVNLSKLKSLQRVGKLTIISNTTFADITLPNLQFIGTSLYVRNNHNAKNISFPSLEAVGADHPKDHWVHIVGNRVAENILFPKLGTSDPFNLCSFIFEDNGSYTSNTLSIDFNNVRKLSKSLNFSKNNNSGVVSFDQIFSKLDSVNGDLIIKNNAHLNECCIAVSSTVSGYRNINGNTGNCADTAAIRSACGKLMKRNVSDLYKNPAPLEVKLYPNPNRGKFIVEIVPPENGLIQLRITDISGRTLRESKFAAIGNIALEAGFDDLKPGNYILYAEMNGSHIIKRVVVY